MEKHRVYAKVPRDVKKMLLADEQVLLAVQQSRLKALFTPDSIIVTNQRVIRYSPSGFLGLHKEIEDYRYENMANFKISKGIMFATLTIGHRFMSESLVLDNLSKDAISDISKIVQENIRQVRTGTPSQPVSFFQSENPLELLKLRFAKGEITREEFEDMKRLLEQ
jgi:hypothetical protein